MNIGGVKQNNNNKPKSSLGKNMVTPPMGEGAYYIYFK